MNLRNWARAFVLFLVVAASVLVAGPHQERIFDRQQMEAFKEDPAFDYSGEYGGSSAWITQLLSSLLGWVARFFDNPGVRWLVPWILRLVIILLVIGAILVLIRLRYGPLVMRKTTSVSSTDPALEMNTAVDYRALAQQSREQGDLKMAIRYLFLACLQQLAAQDLLKLADWKAPVHYVWELPDDKSDHFLHLTRNFEATWYGEYQATSTMVDQCIRLTDQLINEQG